MPRHTPEMPARLAESAFELFSKRGIQQVSLEEVAAHAGVTKGSLYWHYQSKDELLRAACQHYYRTYHRRMKAATGGARGPAARLERALACSVRACLLDEQNRVFTGEVMALALHDAELRAGWREFTASVREFYLNLLEEAGLPGEPGEAVDFMLATMEGLKLKALFEPGLCSPGSERAIIHNLKTVLGLAPGKGRKA